MPESSESKSSKNDFNNPNSDSIKGIQSNSPADTAQSNLSKTTNDLSVDKANSALPKNQLQNLTTNSKPDHEKSELPTKPPKPPKLEDKPFGEFISNHLIPLIRSSINKTGASVHTIKLLYDLTPVVGGKSWNIYCELHNKRRFWLCFSEETITSTKSFTISEGPSEPSLLESFLIDEKKITLSLLNSRILQRLNGQKWLGPN